MEYSECLPARLNPLAERTCFSQVGDGTTRVVCAHPLEAIEDVTVVDDTATFSIDPDSDPWGPDSIDAGDGKDLVFVTAEANLVKPLSLSEGLSVLS